MIRSATRLYQLETFEDRFEYLSLRGNVGEATFGYDRWINQAFYRSREWKNIREQVIARDYGCDLGVEGYEIHDRILIHHMNPMAVSDIVHSNEDILDPEYLISCTHLTHNAIHYGNVRMLPKRHVARKAGDTRLW
jgi:hypothetical protein